MICEHCGKSISLLSNYCEYCGQPVESFPLRLWNVIKKVVTKCVAICKKKKWLLPVVATILAALIVVCVVINVNNKFDIIDYVEVELSGCDGYGKLTVNVDYDELAEKILGKEPNEKSKKEYEEYVQYINNKEELKKLVSVTVDKTENLDNGDFILVTVSVQKSELLEGNNINLPEGTYTKTFEIGVDTEELDKIKKINLFDYIDVEFSGEDDDGYATIVEKKEYKGSPKIEFCDGDWGNTYFKIYFSKDDEEYASVYIYMDDKYYLSNGDTVELTVDNDEQYLAENCGIEISETVKEYTVSGLE